MLKNFIVNTKTKPSKSLEIFFDFIIIATVSIIFNGFVLNSHAAPTYQKVFMCFNAGLVTTFWFAHTFFRQRFEKSNPFFRVVTMFKVISLGIIAAGLDLMIFRLNTSPGKDPQWIAKISMVIWIGGYIFSRMLFFIEYSLCSFVNKENKVIFKLTIGKSLSRLFVVILAIAHLILIALDFQITTLTYIFLPLYLASEFIGNVIFVTNKNLKKAPKVSIAYASERYKKLTYLYIGSLFISGTIQFAYYFKKSTDLYMLGNLMAIYLIGFLMWWFYLEYSHRLIIKQSARNLIKLAFLNIFVTTSMAIFGGSIINSHNDSNKLYIMISSVIALALIFILINSFLSSLYRDDKITILNFKKQSWMLCITNVIILGTFAIINIFVNLPMWSLYIVIITTLISSISLPYILKRINCTKLR
ncbi:low temperature requirement protein A [Mycoplasma marinum]|uniref:Low temperature requirement protein A n=1 Tax=Mycoplasma marinum TaxID=1937190 RepID=A0A4R0XT03_9MOLU|nr:low temperature requirement protein A [Mycoplasma marinum]TCG12023.1 hypothetical protein C4B24_00220 [Mycoplasma marinum]